MNKFKITLIFLLVLMQTSGVLISAYVAANPSGHNLSCAFEGSKITVCDISSIFVVVKSSFQEQLKTITDFAQLPLAYKKDLPGPADTKNNNTNSNNLSSNKLSLNTVNSNSNIVNFSAKYQPPVIFEGIYEQVFVLTSWIVGFLILFKLKKPKNYFFMLARASIDFILPLKVNIYPVAFVKQQGFLMGAENAEERQITQKTKNYV